MCYGAAMATRLKPPHVTIVSDRQILGGMPVVSGTRVPAETILAYIRSGTPMGEIVEDYPYLPLGFYEAVVAWAKASGRL